jgi:hypothetical protein
MNTSDHFSESLETVFRTKIIQFFAADQDPGSGIVFTLDPGSVMEKFRFGIRYDPQHCFLFNLLLHELRKVTKA